MRTALFVATVGGVLNFEKNDIKILQSLGYEVHCASNFTFTLLDDFQAEGIIRHQIDFARVPWSKTNINAYKQLRELFSENHFDIVHCHTPMGGVLGRLVANKYRKSGTKVIYTAHGFHFFKGAPLKNWLLYYPVEWLCAFWTDVLITINREDYSLAKKHMHAKKVEYIPGVGVDTKRFSPDTLSLEEKAALRTELGLKDGEKMLLSVGELSKRKNHEVVIRALAQLNDPTVKYYICGSGEMRNKIQGLIDEFGLTGSVKLLGFRKDISALCDCTDLFVFPSLQEGLPVALMEAVASKTSVICSDIRGSRELVVEKNALFDCRDEEGLAEKIKDYLMQDHTEEAEKNYQNLKKFDISVVIEAMRKLYVNEEKNA